MMLWLPVLAGVAGFLAGRIFRLGEDAIDDTGSDEGMNVIFWVVVAVVLVAMAFGIIYLARKK